MISCSDIIDRALRMGRIISPGEQAESSESEEALSALQGLYDQWVSCGLFGRFTDRVESTDYTASEGERVRLTNGASITIPTTIEDGGDRAPRDLSIVDVWDDADGGTRATYLYEAGVGGWVNVLDLALEDAAPLATRGREGLAACLAEYIAEDYGAQLGPLTLRKAASFKMALSLKLGSDRDRLGSVYY